ncbi:MAG TPA: ornithine cyclodeaminase family protein [Kiloniellales bacterium]|nr:ornithine cyclodeaminase family protein [Kiloniellales bacterium]
MILDHAVAGRAAAQVRKGPLPVLVLDEPTVEALLDPAALLDALALGFTALSSGKVQVPARPQLTVPGAGFLLSMPAWREGSPLAVKQVAVFEGNLARGLPNHLALIALFDPSTGAPLCIMDGTAVTAIRTAAAAVLSVRLLARPDARVVTLVGAGVQAREHLRLLPLVRDFANIRIASLVPEDAERLAAMQPGAVAVTELRKAVAESDVVCLCTHSYAPVIEPAWVRAGTHVTSVGYAPPSGEMPLELLRRGSLFVETREAFAPTPIGCPELAGLDPERASELGEVLAGLRPGRRSAQEITLYKAMGTAMEDLVAAELAWRAALDRGLGRQVTL